jgi:hypothetical protein
MDGYLIICEVANRCENSIVVCNLQKTNKLETFYVNRGKPEGRF